MSEAIWKPTQPVALIAGTPPGGGLDRAARALVRVIEARGLLGVPIRVTNIAGDGAREAWRYMDARAGDRHVLGISASNLTTDHLLGTTPGDYSRYTPLAFLYTEYIAFAVRGDSPLASGADMLRRLAEAPDEFVIALATSLGNPNHVALARIARHVGTDPRALRLRVFDSALDAVADVIAGHAALAAVTAASTAAEQAAGRVRLIAMSSPARLPDPFVGVPTWREQGVACEVNSWRGVSGPAGLGAAERRFWEGVLSAATSTPEWQAELARHAWAPMYLDGPDLLAHLAHERDEMRAALLALGLIGSGPDTPRD
jgi:putative tricarboxylic transport membrane protein